MWILLFFSCINFEFTLVKQNFMQTETYSQDTLEMIRRYFS